ncbi:acyl-CoA synthetase [Pseudonocardia halophobica]|uniref:Acyl-CoA synthetase n=1 Tax=Pseudonocardia halophobica TaxID=29401 RepID=A0A9W6L524_9PSEU|nr:AMP-binding protein [Pseudonocardia halophobica]GLL13817.1 acyl-CoA synthetase [Pseudonocardia halophobica]
MSPSPSAGEVRSFGLLQLWDAVADGVPERECVVQGGRRLTWAEVRERTTRLGWFLTGCGFGPRDGAAVDWRSPNDTVGLLLRNSPEYLEGSIGCYRARCAPFNVNYRYRADELAYLLRDARPVAMVLHREFGPVLEQALALVEDLQPVLVVVEDGSGAALPAGARAYEEVLAGARPPAEPVVPSPDDVHVLYTGGTTGMPKGVIWRLRELAGRPCGIAVESLEAATRDAPRRGWLRAFVAPPLMHGAAAWFSYGAWSRGGTLVLSEDHSFDAERALELCRREKVTWMAIIGDPFAQPLVKALRAGAEPPGLSYIFSSGAALSPSAWSELDTYFPGLKLVNTLGSSETGPQAMQTSSAQPAFRAGPQTFVVSDDHTRLLTAESPGIGWLSNAGELPRGYLNDEVRTAATYKVVEGLRLSISGDRASVDGTGEIRFLGREATVINSGGEKIYGEEVEGVLRALPEIADAIVFGRPSERWGQEVVALLVAAGPELDRDTIRARCADALAGYKIPKAVAYVPAIRRHDNGKADYAWAGETFASLVAEVSA